MRTTFFMNAKLRLNMLVSRAVAAGAMVVMATAAQSHEVMPTIGQLSTSYVTVQLELRLNAEALVAGIDLDGLTDTNNSDQSATYDELRELPPEELGQRMSEDWPVTSQGLTLTTDDQPVPLLSLIHL
mgnify:FL=1